MDLTISPYRQTFTAGELKFIKTISADGKVDDLAGILRFQMPKELEILRRLITKRPYDLFISRTEGLKGFYSVDANVEWVNVIGFDPAKKGRTSVVNADKLERIISAASDAMQSFERADDYQMLVKKHNSFFKQLKSLFFVKNGV